MRVCMLCVTAEVSADAPTLPPWPAAEQVVSGPCILLTDLHEGFCGQLAASRCFVVSVSECLCWVFVSLRLSPLWKRLPPQGFEPRSVDLQAAALPLSYGGGDFH